MIELMFCTVKIPPRVMFITQIYGTILGGFLNYAVMISIVSGNAELLTSGNGDSSWSGATIQSYNTNASSWALAKYLYQTGKTYSTVPLGIAVGAGLVVVHRIFAQVNNPLRMPLAIVLTNLSNSLSRRYTNSRPTTSTCRSCFSTPVIYHTISHRHA
jgi:hypothetical protein